ncbi:hypothetical protein AAG747_05160 [Rapidithrix thailandica]|uniref:Uncharacterized protein n=1 Tax=Rapidithrix thailandica TaxID=413964 RepID=A0AAW9RW55_9BACT
MITSNPESKRFIINEAQGLLNRLEQVQPFVINMPSVTAARVPQLAQSQIDMFLSKGKEKLRQQILGFIDRNSKSRDVRPEVLQRTYSFLKLSFNALLDQLDIFADVLTQRSEQDAGIVLAGLDALAKDALAIQGSPSPEVVCYLDRGHGAAIRRARTRLPGGTLNPVAIIKVPRERMVGSGIASSLIHEVGHQGAVLLGLLNSMRLVLKQQQLKEPQATPEWASYERWISEILADFWSVAQLGIGATLGLIGVVSLPRYFVFRMNMDDPHPFPYIRVKISIAIGKALYPNPQWTALEKLWESLYPLTQTDKNTIHSIKRLESKLPAFVNLLVHHSPASLNGRKLKSLFPLEQRQAQNLRKAYRTWHSQPKLSQTARPAFAFAVIGQAKADLQISTKRESQLLMQLLKHWALKKVVSGPIA